MPVDLVDDGKVIMAESCNPMFPGEQPVPCFHSWIYGLVHLIVQDWVFKDGDNIRT